MRFSTWGFQGRGYFLLPNVHTVRGCRDVYLFSSQILDLIPSYQILSTHVNREKYALCTSKHHSLRCSVLFRDSWPNLRGLMAQFRIVLAFVDSYALSLWLGFYTKVHNPFSLLDCLNVCIHWLEKKRHPCMRCRWLALWFGEVSANYDCVKSD